MNTPTLTNTRAMSSSPIYSSQTMVSNESESDEEDIAGLMSLLDDPEDAGGSLSAAGIVRNGPTATVLDLSENYKNKASRDKLGTSFAFKNFKLGQNGYQNHRDATVLGNPPGLIIPDALRKFENIRIGIYLDTEYDCKDNRLEKACRVSAPVFCNQNMKTIHSELQCTYPVETHELWIQTQTLGPECTILFKKRCLDLSRRYRKVSGTKWPQFVIVATPAIGGKMVYSASVRTLPFEVRSKEQSNKTAAARGHASATVTKRRRTPETEDAANLLHNT